MSRWKWTEERDDALKTLFENEYSDEEIADHFELESVQIVQMRRLKLGLRRRSHRGGQPPWSEEELRLLEETKHMRADKAAEVIGRSRYAVLNMRRERGIKSTLFRRWEPWQLQILHRDYIEKGPKHVADMTGFDIKSVWTKASTEGIRRRA